MSIAFKTEPLLCIPFSRATLSIDSFLPYSVVKPDCFVVHYLMLLPILINPVYGVSARCPPQASQQLAARCPGVAVPVEGPDPALCFLSAVLLPTGRCLAAFPLWWKSLFQRLAGKPTTMHPSSPHLGSLACLPASHSPDLAWVRAPEAIC